jgi:hypothetical protein
MNVDKSVARMRTLQGENDGRPPRDGNSRTRLGLARTLLAATALVSFSQIASAQTVLPANAKTTCTVSAVEFADWFISGTVTVNGGVDPANSLTFPNMPNCSFYKWSEQMFLWLTSPVPAKYGGGTHVFNSPVFYDVSPPDPNDGFKRTLTPNTRVASAFSTPAFQLGRPRSRWRSTRPENIHHRPSHGADRQAADP